MKKTKKYRRIPNDLMEKLDYIMYKMYKAKQRAFSDYYQDGYFYDENIEKLEELDAYKRRLVEKMYSADEYEYEKAKKCINSVYEKVKKEEERVSYLDDHVWLNVFLYFLLPVLSGILIVTLMYVLIVK